MFVAEKRRRIDFLCWEISMAAWERNPLPIVESSVCMDCFHAVSMKTERAQCENTFYACSCDWTRFTLCRIEFLLGRFALHNTYKIYTSRLGWFGTTLLNRLFLETLMELYNHEFNLNSLRKWNSQRTSLNYHLDGFDACINVWLWRTIQTVPELMRGSIFAFSTVQPTTWRKQITKKKGPKQNLGGFSILQKNANSPENRSTLQAIDVPAKKYTPKLIISQDDQLNLQRRQQPWNSSQPPF